MSKFPLLLAQYFRSFNSGPLLGINGIVKEDYQKIY